jgi:hypothetical protein
MTMEAQPKLTKVQEMLRSAIDNDQVSITMIETLQHRFSETDSASIELSRIQAKIFANAEILKELRKSLTESQYTEQN